jgi:hypothetical protein
LVQKPKTNKFVVNSTRTGDRKRRIDATEESTSSLHDGTRLERDASGRLVVFQTGKKPFVISQGKWKNGRNMRSRPDLAQGQRRPERNPHSRKFAKRKAAEQGLEGTDAENDILRETKCKNCGGTWHIAADCKGKRKDDKENVNPNPAGKKTPGSGKKNKNYMSQRIGSKSDPCESDNEELPQDEDEDEDRDINPRRLRGFFD